MTIRRNLATRALVALSAAALLVACDDGPLQSASPAPSAAQSRAGTGADVARALAAGLNDPSVRAGVHAALRESPLNEHKLALGEFVRTAPGRALVAAAAARGGVQEGTLRRWIAGLGATDFYLPVASHRGTWRASEPVLVGYTANVDAPLLTSYDAAGAAQVLDARQGVPSQALLILHPGEPTWTRREARGGMQIATNLNGGDSWCEPNSDICEHDPEGGIDGGYTSTLTRVYAIEGDAWGDIELMVKHYTQPGGTQLDEWLGSGFNRWTSHSLNALIYRDGDAQTWVKVWERDSGFPEVGGDDFWGENWMAASGVARTFYADSVPTVQLTYVY